MSAQKEDYRTNRADYAIAAHGQAVAENGDREALLASTKPLWPRDRRTVRLTANPLESLPRRRARPRGLG